MLCNRECLALNANLLNWPYQILVCIVFFKQKPFIKPGFQTDFSVRNKIVICINALTL